MRTVPDECPNKDATEENRVACLDCPARMSDLCQGLSDLNLPALYESSHHIDLEKGQNIQLDKETKPYIFNIREGMVKLSRIGANGQRQIFSFLFSGDLFGVIPSDDHGLCAETCTPTKLCRWEKQKFEDLLILYPGMDRQYHKIMSKIVGQTINLAFSLGQLTAEQRLAGFLLNISERQEEQNSQPGLYSLDMSRTDIADYLGLKIETVSRGLSKMKSDKVIELPTQHSVRILDRNWLEDHCGSN